MNDADGSNGGFGFELPKDEASRDRLAELGQLASGLVHELKNPLGALDLNIAMLEQAAERDQLDNDKTLRRLARLRTCSDHLQGIIQSFLSFARPGKPDRDRVDINNLLMAVLEEQHERLEQAAIDIHLNLEPDLSAVAADQGHLRSVFLNIILNARDALLLREADRRLLIFTRNRSDHIAILIGNNGPPLSDTAAAHLFDAFYSDKEGGTGLGLAIVRRLVELHHGRVAVHSHPDQGVSFTIELPTRLGPAKARTQLPLGDFEGPQSAQDETDHFERIINIAPDGRSSSATDP